MYIKYVMSVASVLALNGCTSTGHFLSNTEATRPTQVIRTETAATQLLRCIGNLTELSSKSGVNMLVWRIHDLTLPPKTYSPSLLSYGGGTQYIKSAVDRLASSKVMVVENHTPYDSSRGMMVLEGGYTEHHRPGTSSAGGVGGSNQTTSIDFGGTINTETIALDLGVKNALGVRIGRLGTSLEVWLKDSDRDGGIKIRSSSGKSFNLSFGRKTSHSRHHGQRLLAEFGVAHIISTWFDIPLESCLDAPGDNPALRAELMKRYKQLRRRGKTRAIQAALLDLGFPPGPIDGRFGAQTASAIKRYQVSSSLPATGLMSDDLFIRLEIDKIDGS